MSAALAAIDGPVLGGTKARWVAAHGQPEPVLLFERFRNGAEVGWRTAADGAQRASHIEVLFAREVPVADARQMVQTLHPRDAESVRKYTAPAGQTVEVFRSNALAEAFSNERPGGGSNFGDAPAGTFIQIAERGSPRTGRVVIAIGDNP